MALTSQQIHAAAEAIAQRGERPTQAAVRAELGGGSFTTIAEALRSWRTAKAEEEALAMVAVPKAIAERTQQLQALIWESAVAEAERRVQAEREALAEARGILESEVSELRDAVETLEAEAEQRQQQITALTVDRDKAVAKVVTLEAKVAQDAAVAHVKIEGLEQRLADALAMVEKVTGMTAHQKGSGDRKGKVSKKEVQGDLSLG